MTHLEAAVEAAPFEFGQQRGGDAGVPPRQDQVSYVAAGVRRHIYEVFPVGARRTGNATAAVTGPASARPCTVSTSNVYTYNIIYF